MSFSRRQFGAAGMAALAFTGAARLSSKTGKEPAEVRGLGPLVADRGRLLDLPQGFAYSAISRFGETMDDGFAVPDQFDGMGCFALDSSRVALVRNHELKTGDNDKGPSRGLPALEARLRQAPHFGSDSTGLVLPGSVSTIVYNLRTRQRERQYLSLAGTSVNCAGGETPWGSWLSCEESVLGAPDLPQAHGWVFEVPARQRGLANSRPLTAMGRFRHEAAAIDPRTGIVYQTEDRDDGLFYRFVPADRRNLAAGGRLQALAFHDQARSTDTRNWSTMSFPPLASLPVRWIDLTETDSPRDDLRKRGQSDGAAIFARGEGIYRGRGDFFFTCTSGGSGKHGQIMRYVPSPKEGRDGEAREPGRLQLFVESTDPDRLDYADNLTVAPWGDLIVCEDRTRGATNHVRGITPRGEIYTLARLNTPTETAGACFSPDGATMFLNIYSPGQTLAITGPWPRRRLA